MIDIFPGKLGQSDSHLVGCAPTALNAGVDDVVNDVDTLHHTVPCVGCATGQSVAVVNMFQGTEPLLAPPSFSVDCCHDVLFIQVSQAQLSEVRGEW